jgi:hypothetical protein
MLDSIPGVYITKAALTLPEAASAPDEPHYVVIRRRGRRIRITFNRLQYRQPGYNTARWYWSWTASSGARGMKIPRYIVHQENVIANSPWIVIRSEDGEPAIWVHYPKVGKVPLRFRSEALAQAAADQLNAGG